MPRKLIEEVPGGYRIDGLDLLGSRPVGLPNLAEGDSRRTYSTVKWEGNVVAFFAKAATAMTRESYEWGYRVKKGMMEVDVLVYDTRTPQTDPFEGHYPPPIRAWQERGWEILSRFERPLTAPGKPPG